MFIAEGPGEQEDETGIPFHPNARAGREFTHLLQLLRLTRDDVYITNIVKDRVPNNKDPNTACIAACRKWLLQEFILTQPTIIASVGRIATQSFLGDVDMEQVHGIPFRVTIPETEQSVVVVPVFHPASGLRSPEYMLKCQLDFEALRMTIQGKIQPGHFKDPLAGKEMYSLIEDPKEITSLLQSSQIIAVDTETLPRADNPYFPYMVSFSDAPGVGRVIMADNKPAIKALGDVLATPGVLTLIHNALFDLFVLDPLGIFPHTIHDTMIIAYLLQSEPQGLKALAFRHWGMKMKDYDDMVALASSGLAKNYLLEVLKHDWPDPDPVEEILPGGKIHLRKPRNVAKLVDKIFKDHAKLKISPEDFWRRWHSIGTDAGRGLVEIVLGPMKEGDLSMIDPAEAIFYSARDSDSTIRIYPYLISRLREMGMLEVLDMDMGVVPMVKDMMQVGIQPDLPAMKLLGDRFGRRILELETDIEHLSGHKINVGSPLQVAELLFDQLRIPAYKKNRSTEDKVLSRIVGFHPVIPKIREWRSYSKLKTTYTNKLPGFIGLDGRIHATVKLTRTSTGRLSMANPNLQNQPTRSEDGRAIRDAFVAAPGCSFVSVDLSQIEMRLLAHETKDPGLVKIFREGLDIHAQTASGVFKLPIDQLDDMKHRYPAKRVGFGIVYGITESGLREQLLMIGLDPKEWTLQSCKNLISAWYKLYPGVLEYQGRTALHVRRYGFVRDMWGRVRYIATIHSADPRLQAEALRMSGNQPIQSGAQGVIKKAMKDLVPYYREFQAMGYVCRPLIQIHDDLVFEVSDEMVDLWVPIQLDIMSNVVKLSIPIKADAKVGKRWGSMEKFKG
uniref:Putative DNA polymerase n=1 Tax=viral metagenome TaxID=1070528 RepID=A0A6M3LBV9_9ZZZZ